VTQPLFAFSAALSSALLAAVWQGALLAAAVALALRLFPAIPAAVRSFVWTATFVVLIALHILPAHPEATARVAHELRVAPVWSVAFATLWLALSCFRAVQFALSALRLREIARRATPIGPPPTCQGRRYTLCVSPDVDRPSVLGFFHPRILLPPALLASLAPEQLRQILLHETEHLRRSDDWSNLLQKLALVVFPLNPALAWVERRLCLERELACDDRVLEATGARKAYATCLAHLAEHSMLRRSLGLALGVLGSRTRPSELANRVHRILSQPATRLNPAQSRLAAAVLLCGLVGGAVTLAHAPRLVSFAPVASPAGQTVAQSAAPSTLASTPRPILVKAVVPAQAAVQRAMARRAIHRNAPRSIETEWRSNRLPEPRITLTLSSGQQVRQFVVPAIAYAPAYAAVRVPEGWIIIEL
jgi:beta-lactamase regulating signal transducer with metallopeptidase domain